MYHGGGVPREYRGPLARIPHHRGEGRGSWFLNSKVVDSSHASIVQVTPHPVPPCGTTLSPREREGGFFLGGLMSRVPQGGIARLLPQPRRGAASIAGGNAPGNRAHPLTPFPSPRSRGEGCRRRGVGVLFPWVSPTAIHVAPLRGAPNGQTFLGLTSSASGLPHLSQAPEPDLDKSGSKAPLLMSCRYRCGRLGFFNALQCAPRVYWICGCTVASMFSGPFRVTGKA